MSVPTHERARALVLASLVEGVSEADHAWLQAHLSECGACQRLVEDVRSGLGALRLPEVAASPELVGITQRRLRAHARGVSEAEGHRWLLVGSMALGLVSASAMAIGLVIALRALVERAGLPVPVAVAFFIEVWFLPASLAALATILVAQREQTATLVPWRSGHGQTE